MRAQAQAKLGKPVTLAIMNAGGLRKNEISPVNCAPADIFELLPFENALVVLELNGAQLAKLLRLQRAMRRPARAFTSSGTIRTARNSSAASSSTKRSRTGDRSAKDVHGGHDRLPRETRQRSYALLQEAKSTTPVNLTLRESIIDYVKTETAAWAQHPGARR
jgi:hypothetical protein